MRPDPWWIRDVFTVFRQQPEAGAHAADSTLDLRNPLIYLLLNVAGSSIRGPVHTGRENSYGLGFDNATPEFAETQEVGQFSRSLVFDHSRRVEQVACKQVLKKVPGRLFQAMPLVGIIEPKVEGFVSSAP